MKKRIIHIVCLVLCVLNGYAKMLLSEDIANIQLDMAIREAAQKFKLEFEEGTYPNIIGCLPIPTKSFDDYFVEILIAELEKGQLIGRQGIRRSPIKYYKEERTQ